MIYMMFPILYRLTFQHPLPAWSLPSLFPLRIFVRHEHVRPKSKDRRMDSLGILSIGLHWQVFQNNGHSLHHTVYRRVLSGQTCWLVVGPLPLCAGLQTGQRLEALFAADWLGAISIQTVLVSTCRHSFLLGRKGNDCMPWGWFVLDEMKF